MLGDNVFTEISTISVLLSRYDNNHDNYMKGVKQYKKECTLTRYHAKIPNTSTMFGEDVLASQKNTLKQ